MIPINNYDNYLISKTGDIKNIKTGKYKKATKNKSLGYSQVTLYSNNIKSTKYVHRLIAEHFIPNPNNLSEVNHIDSNRDNNSIDNLEWVDSRTNSLHAVGMGRRDHLTRMDESKIKEAFELVMKGFSYKEVSKILKGSWQSGFLSVKVKQYAKRYNLDTLLLKELEKQRVTRGNKNLEKINGV